MLGVRLDKRRQCPSRLGRFRSQRRESPRGPECCRTAVLVCQFVTGNLHRQAVRLASRLRLSMTERFRTDREEQLCRGLPLR